MRWLGTAGFELRTSSGRLLFDPFVSQPPPLTRIGGRLASNRALLERTVSFDPTDAILIGHSHYNHLLDAPLLARMTGAEVFGSATTCVLTQRMERKASCQVIRGKRHKGPFSIAALPSRHSGGFFGPWLPGEVSRPPRWKHPHLLNMPAGAPLIWVVQTRGLTIVHLSTAGLPEAPLLLSRAVPQGSDVLLVALDQRENTPGYLRTLIAQLRPKTIIPHHPGTEDPGEVQAIFRKFKAEVKGQAEVLIPERFETYVFEGAALGQR